MTTFADAPEEMCPTFLPAEVENTYANIEGGKRVALPSMDQKEAAEDTQWVTDAKKMFEKYDENGDNCMSEQELTRLLGVINPGMTKADIKALMNEADKNGNGKIEFAEFLDWLVAPAEELSLGRAMLDKDYAKCFKVIFDAYDVDGTGKISDENFEACHCLLQAVFNMRGGDDGKPQRTDPLKLEEAHDEVFAQITKNGGHDEITFRMFTDWMKAHVPMHLDKAELYDHCSGLALSLVNLRKTMKRAEDGLIAEKDAHILEEVIGRVVNKTADFVVGLSSKPGQLADGQSQWTEPPRGLNVEKLKQMHMTVAPVKMKLVKNMEFEILCLPMPGKYDDPESRVWLAEVIRRIDYKSGKTSVDDPEYYVYDRKEFKFKTVSQDDHDKFVKVFEQLTPGIGIFCLLKTAANFGTKLTWEQCVNALHGAQDMNLLKPAQFDVWEKNMLEQAQHVLREEGMLDGIQPGEAKEAAQTRMLNAALEFLDKNYASRPREVMGILSTLGFVDIDPAWEDFV